MIDIKGSVFCLRQWKLSDGQSLVKYANDPQVAYFLADRFPYPYTVTDAEEWLNYQASKNVIDNLAIDIGGEAVGGLGLEFRQDIFRKTAIIGYWLGSPFWRTGIMTEALKLMVHYAFENFDLARIQAGVFEGNLASMRVLEKVGFVKESISKKALFKRDTLFDEHVYAILK